MTDKRDLPILPQIEIADPCPMKWSDLHGDDRKRFCDQCQKHVLNFSAMPAKEINAVLATGESVCAQIHKRADGSIVTKEPVSFRRRCLSRLTAMAASIIGILTFGGCDETTIRQWIPFVGPAAEEHEGIRGEIEFMGDVAPPADLEMGGVRALGKVLPNPPNRGVQ